MLELITRQNSFVKPPQSEGLKRLYEKRAQSAFSNNVEVFLEIIKIAPNLR